MTATDLAAAPWVRLGRVLRAHGVRGVLRLRLDLAWQDLRPPVDALMLCPPGQRLPADTPWRVVQVVDAVGGALATLEGLSCRERAQSLQGHEVWVPERCLPVCAPGEFWVHEVMGAQVEDAQHGALGEVACLEDRGGQLVAVVRGGRAADLEVPMVPAIVRRWDRAGRRLEVALPAGLWEAATG